MGIEEKDVQNLHEKRKLEFYAVYNFLKTYREAKETEFEILELSDYPDVIARIEDEIIGFEVTHVYCDPHEPKMLLGQEEESFRLDNCHSSEELIKGINSLIERKSRNNYGRNVWLLIGVASPIFDYDILEAYKHLIHIPENNFKQIWVEFYSSGSICQIMS